MSKHGGLGNKWHARVFGDSGYICQAETHAPDCNGFPTEAHHIVYRRRLIKAALWEVANGIALSKECHMLAHASRNANIEEARLRRAVDAINKIQGEEKGGAFRIAHFFDKGLHR